MPDLSVWFVRPTDSQKMHPATLASTATPKFIVAKLVETGFVPAPEPGSPYGLVTGDGRHLDPDTTLEAAEVTPGTVFTVTPFGAGALGQNAGLNLALAGIGYLIVVDFDHFEPHNRTRSPLFPSDGDRRR